jgi:hypothetical protein
MLGLGAGLLALALGGCNDGGANRSAEANLATENAASNAAGNAPDNATGNASGNSAATSLCFFGPDDVKDWKAVEGPDNTRTAGMIRVTGKARVADPKYKAKLTRFDESGGVLRLWLTHAENDGEASEDGWYDLTYGWAGGGASKVVIRCDEDTNLAELDVETMKR